MTDKARSRNKKLPEGVFKTADVLDLLQGTPNRAVQEYMVGEPLTDNGKLAATRLICTRAIRNHNLSLAAVCFTVDKSDKQAYARWLAEQETVLGKTVRVPRLKRYVPPPMPQHLY